MKCPHCTVAFFPETERLGIGVDVDPRAVRDLLVRLKCLTILKKITPKLVSLSQTAQKLPLR